jgi:hypothetical protein
MLQKFIGSTTIDCLVLAFSYVLLITNNLGGAEASMQSDWLALTSGPRASPQHLQ